MENEKEKKGLLARLKPKKDKKNSCCCEFEIEEIKDEELEDQSKDRKDTDT
jgi:hypothetical protein